MIDAKTITAIVIGSENTPSSLMPTCDRTLILLTREYSYMSDPDWTIGETVLDRDDADADPAVVVNTPSIPASEWDIPRIEKTTAEDNPAYPADAVVAVVVYEDDLDDVFPEWGRDQPIAMTTLNNARVDHYSFPAPRLEPVHRERSTAETTANDTADGETNAEKRTSEHEDENEADTVEDDVETPCSESGTETTAPSDAPPEPSATLLALKERLEEGGMMVELGEEHQTLRAEKLGQSYRLRPGEVIAGEGALRDRLEDIVTNDIPGHT